MKVLYFPDYNQYTRVTPTKYMPILTYNTYCELIWDGNDPMSRLKPLLKGINNSF